MIDVKEYIEKKKKSPFYTKDEYEGKEQDKQDIIEFNKWLTAEYPFLIPHSRWSGKPITTKEEGYWPGDKTKIPTYNYSYTELDDLPDGWYITFGLALCKEIKEELLRSNLLDKYMITQIKEKFGILRWYDMYSNNKIHEIIQNYTRLSEKICILCGESAEYVTTGWISYYCKDCKDKLEKDGINDFITIDDFNKNYKLF